MFRRAYALLNMTYFPSILCGAAEAAPFQNLSSGQVEEEDLGFLA
jgi:hypothetical protein